MKNKLLAIISSLFISSTLYAHGVDNLHFTPYEQGVAQVAVEWQGTDVTVTAVFPAQDVVGFEHIPANAKEKRAVRDAYQRFIDNPVVMAKGCQPQEVKVNSALFDEHANGEDESFFGGLLGDNSTSETINTAEHMDFQAIYRFSCDVAKKPLKFMSFPVFSGLKQARIRQGNMSNEATQTLTSKQTVINPVGVN